MKFSLIITLLKLKIIQILIILFKLLVLITIKGIIKTNNLVIYKLIINNKNNDNYNIKHIFIRTLFIILYSNNNTKIYIIILTIY